MSYTIPQPVPTDCRKYAISLMEFNNLNTFNNVIPREQIKYAQQEIRKAGKELVSANMRLEGTPYENDMRKVMDALSALNNRLVNDLNK